MSRPPRGSTLFPYTTLFRSSHGDCRVARNAPVVLRLKRRRPRPSIGRGFARPERRPNHTFGRREQRLRRGVEVYIAPEVDEEQSVVALTPEEAEHESLVAKNCAVNAARPLRTEDRVFAPQTQKVAVHLLNLSVLLSLREVELAA